MRVVSGHSGIFVSGARGGNPSRSPQGFHVRHLSGCRGARQGADAILIIMAAVTDTQATELADAAAEWNMDILYEVHNEEMARLHLYRHASSESIIAICVALRPASTPPQPSRQRAADAFLISESGIGTHSDIACLMADGVSGFLVGESLMRQTILRSGTDASRHQTNQNRTLINEPCLQRIK